MTSRRGGLAATREMFPPRGVVALLPTNMVWKEGQAEPLGFLCGRAVSVWRRISEGWSQLCWPSCSPGFLSYTTWTYTAPAAEPPSSIDLWMYSLVSQETLIVSITMLFIRVVFPFTIHQILTALLTLVRRLQKATELLCTRKGCLVGGIGVRPYWTQWPLIIKDFRAMNVPQNHNRGKQILLSRLINQWPVWKLAIGSEG